MTAVALTGRLTSRSSAGAGIAPPILSLTDKQVFTALRAVLLGMLPGLTIVRGQDNEVPESRAADFITMTGTFRRRLSTNVDTLAYAGFAGLHQAQTAEQMDVQLDIHGPNGVNNAEIIKTLFRDAYACEAFAAQGVDLQPLYADEVRQVPFVNAESQYEDRWIVDISMQGNFVITTPQQYANTLVAGIVEVDTTFRP